jgi:type I restriction enzyme S subunit
LPDDWKKVQLRDVCTVHNRQVRPAEFSKYDYYVGLEDIESDTGRIIEYRKVSRANLRSSKFLFDSSCILYGKLRPYLNKVALPELTGICSTDILPLQAVQAKVLREYLYFFLRSRTFTEVATAKSTGANLPRITPDSLLSISIPVPPIATQRRIAEILRRMDGLRQKRQQATQLANKIIQSVFLKMFGDPARNPLGVEMVNVESVCTTIVDGTHATPHYVSEGIPCLSAKNIRKTGIDFGDIRFVSEQEFAFLTKRVRPSPGDVLFSSIGTIGNARVVDTDRPFCIIRSVTLLRSNAVKVLAKYLEAALNTNFVYTQAMNMARRVSVPDLFQKDIRELIIPLPALEAQERFVGLAHETERIHERQTQSSREINELFHSLMHRAFRGELDQQISTH